MLYCKACGNVVAEQDRFCEKCSARLDKPDSVLDSTDYILEKKEGEFDPESVRITNDLLAYEVFGFRLVEKRYSLFTDTYYDGTRLADSAQSAVIRHKVFPIPDVYQQLLMEFSLNKKKTDDFVDALVRQYVQRLEDYRQTCEKAGVACVFSQIKTYYSKGENLHHIFFHMQKADPLLKYIESRRLTVRECVQMAIKLTGQVALLHKYEQTHGDISDDNVFWDPEGELFLGPPERAAFRFHATGLDGWTAYRGLFEPTDGPKTPQAAYAKDIYAIGVLLHRMLGGFRHPFLNSYQQDAGHEDYRRAEENRRNMLVPPLPFYAQNAIGTAVVKACSPYPSRFRSVDELHRILENSLNYLSAEELDRMAVSYDEISQGVPLLSISGDRNRPPQGPQTLSGSGGAGNGGVQVTRNLEQEEKESKNRKTGVLIIVIICAVVLVFVVILFLWDRNTDRTYKGAEQAAGINSVDISVPGRGWKRTYAIDTGRTASADQYGLAGKDQR